MISATTPFLLLGTIFVAVPIILHLIMRRQPKRLEFPALRFLRKREVSNRRKLKLRHLLLLLLRCGVIALLAFALARLRVQSTVLGSAEGPVAAAIVIDTTPRMLYRQNNETRLEAAQEMATWLLTQLPAESDLAVIDSRPVPATFALDAGSAQNRIDQLRPTNVARPLVGSLREALRLLGESDKQRKEVYVLTDLAQWSWPQGSRDQLEQQLSDLAGVSIYLIDVSADTPSNFALAELTIPKQVIYQGDSLVIETELHCEGTAGERKVELHLSAGAAALRVGLDGRPQNVNTRLRGSETVTLTAGESQPLRFTVSNLEVGLHQGFVKIARDDALGVDNFRYFSVEVKQAPKVLVVAPSPTEEYAEFFVEALAPTSLQERGAAPFRPQVILLDELAKQTLDELGAYEAICLLDPPPLDEETWKQLADYAAAGGGVAIYLGHNAAGKDGKTFNSPAAQQLLGGRLARVWKRPDDEPTYLMIDDYSHPVMTKFEPHRSRTFWSALPVRKYWHIKQPAAGVEVVMSFADGHIAMLDRPLGAGRVLTMTTPVADLKQKWNDFANSNGAWLFVELMESMVVYLAGGGSDSLNHTAGATAVLHVPASDEQQIYSLTTPQGDQINQIASKNAVTVSSTYAIGNYRLRRGGDEGGFDRGFSVNLAGEMIDLTRIDPEQLDEIFDSQPYQIARSREEIVRERTAGRVGRELFTTFIVIVAVLLALEHLLASFFYRGREAAPTDSETPASEFKHKQEEPVLAQSV